jgi:hypothetical protein
MRSEGLSKITKYLFQAVNNLSEIRIWYNAAEESLPQPYRSMEKQTGGHIYYSIYDYIIVPICVLQPSVPCGRMAEQPQYGLWAWPNSTERAVVLVESATMQYDGFRL